MNLIRRGVLPLGFLSNGISCGIKKSGKKDLGLIYSTIPAVAAGMFTTNKVQAAPVVISKRNLNKNMAQAVIINSGNANCSTGKQGLLDAEKMAASVSENLDLSKRDVLVASTGIIGKRLQIAKIKKSVPILVKGLRKDGLLATNQAIMTTDIEPKNISVSLKIGGKTVIITGIAKGAGMIYPNMATMLSFIMTDINISPDFLKLALKIAVEKSFNSISIDGCMSTNDCVIILANGLAGNGAVNRKSFSEFSAALDYVCLGLAKKIVKDAEGATKFIEVIVKGASSVGDAKKVAFSIANSTLLKTAIFGENENWGRIIAAVGASGVDIKEEDVRIKFSAFTKKEIRIEVNLNKGKAQWIVYTSDLSIEYVKINADYN